MKFYEVGQHVLRFVITVTKITFFYKIPIELLSRHQGLSTEPLHYTSYWSSLLHLAYYKNFHVMVCWFSMPICYIVSYTSASVPSSMDH